jgi:hypothetical protein
MAGFTDRCGRRARMRCCDNVVKLRGRTCHTFATLFTSIREFGCGHIATWRA